MVNAALMKTQHELINPTPKNCSPKSKITRQHLLRVFHFKKQTGSHASCFNPLYVISSKHIKEYQLINICIKKRNI